LFILHTEAATPILTDACTLNHFSLFLVALLCSRRVSNITVWGTDLLSWEDLRHIPLEGYSISINTFLSAEKHFDIFSDDLEQDLPHSLLVMTSINLKQMQSAEHVILAFVLTGVLLLSCILLGKEIDVLVIAPLEVMSRMVKKLSDNPMEQIKFDTADFSKNPSRF
jgi:hypothetical protein